MQCCIRQKWPVASLLPPLTTTPVLPLSPATPPSALSNLLISSIWRTPKPWTSSSSRSIFALSHCGWSL